MGCGSIWRALKRYNEADMFGRAQGISSCRRSAPAQSVGPVEAHHPRLRLMPPGAPRSQRPPWPTISRVNRSRYNLSRFARRCRLPALLNVDHFGVARAQAAQFLAYRFRFMLVAEEPPPPVVGGPLAAAAVVPPRDRR